MTPLRALAAAFAATWLALVAEPSPAPSPMTDDDVVALISKGALEDEVAAAIRSRPAAFDLSPEMLDELRSAGVTEPILRLMRERQAAVPSPSPAAAPAAAGARSRVSFPVAVEGTRGGKRRFALPPRIDAKAARALGADVPLLAESPRIEQAALFLACTTPEHVPEGWRDGSPLGAAFPAIPRHEILAFPTFAPAPGKKEAAVEIVAPESLDADLDPRAEHDLAFGVAVRVAGEWRVAAVGSLKAYRPDDSARTVELVLRTGTGALGLEAEIRSAARRSSRPPPPPS